MKMKKLDTEGVHASKILLCRLATSPACLDGHDHSSTESFPTPKCVCTNLILIDLENLKDSFKITKITD